MTAGRRRHAARARLAAFCAAAVAAAFTFPAALAAQATHAVAGTVRDSATGAPVAGAAVDLAGATFGRGVRTDEDGVFRIQRVPVGDYQLFIRQIGFIGARAHFLVDTSDVSLALTLVRVARTLDTVRVRAGVTAIRGLVGTAHDLRPLAGATVRVIGAEHDATTDSLGQFFVLLKKPGAYVMRVSHSGFAAQLQSVAVAPEHVVETATLLDSSLKQPRDADALWADFAARARVRGPHSAILTGTEVARYGGSLLDAIQGSPSFSQHGLRLGPQTCVFINGRAEPGFSLNAIRVEEVASVELYGPGTGGDGTGSLAMAWPHRARCGDNPGIAAPRGAGSGTNTVTAAVIWLKP